MRLIVSKESKRNPRSSGIAKKKDDQESPTESVANSPKTQYSSESQRQPSSKSGSPSWRRDQIKIDREVILDINPDTLPQDAQFKGHQEVVVQDIKVQTDNILFKKAKEKGINNFPIWVRKKKVGGLVGWWVGGLVRISIIAN